MGHGELVQLFCESFEDQSELIWRHLKTILSSAGMNIKNLVFLRAYLLRQEHMEANKAIRKKHPGDHEVGMKSASP